MEEEEYTEFYKSISREEEDPMAKIHFTAEGEVTFKSILFVPKKSPEDYHGRRLDSIKLYVRRVFITDNFEEMMPRYLTFVRGVVGIKPSWCYLLCCFGGGILLSLILLLCVCVGGWGGGGLAFYAAFVGGGGTVVSYAAFVVGGRGGRGNCCLLCCLCVYACWGGAVVSYAAFVGGGGGKGGGTVVSYAAFFGGEREGELLSLMLLLWGEGGGTVVSYAAFVCIHVGGGGGGGLLSLMLLLCVCMWEGGGLLSLMLLLWREGEEENC